MRTEVSKFRLNSLRAVYLLIFVVLGASVWPTIIDPDALFEPVEGVAYSFWAAYSLLAVLGIRFPLKMLPLLFVQLSYKTIWLLAVGLPLWSAGELNATAIELVEACAIGVIIDLVVIPWPYVFSHFIVKPRVPQFNSEQI